MFRVVADQLKISEGWVRCGHCADVFDATLYLQPWVAPGSSAEPEAEPQPDPDYDDEPETAIMEDSEMSGEWGELEGSRRFQESTELPESPESPEDL